MCRDISPTSEIRAEIQMKSGHLFWTKYREKSDVIDLQAVFSDYWTSIKREFTVESQPESPTSPLISDGEMQKALTLENTVAPWNYSSLQTLPFVSL